MPPSLRFDAAHRAPVWANVCGAASTGSTGIQIAPVIPEQAAHQTVFLPYAGGMAPYASLCREMASDGYRGFVLR